MGLAQLGYGAYQKGKAKKAYNAISDTPYDISKLYNDNVGLSESQAQTGFSPETTNYFTQQLQQGLASSSNAMLQAGGGINEFANAYQNYTQGIKSFSLENDKLKMAKIKQLIEDRSALAREQTQQWAINKYRKMQDQKAAAALMLGNANSTMNQGINTTVQGASQLWQYYLSDKAPTTNPSMDDQNKTLNPYLMEGDYSSNTDILGKNNTSLPNGYWENNYAYSSPQIPQ